MRALRATLVVTAATAVVVAATAAPALADPTITNGASAYSAGAGTGTASLKANLKLKGSLGSLLDDIVGPIVSQDLNPLLGALQATIGTVVATALGGSSTYNAATTGTQTQVATPPAAFPNDTLPSPCTSSGSQPCYSATSTAGINAAPLVTAGVGAVNGYVEQVAGSATDTTNPIFGRATVASPQVSVLPGISSLVPGLPNAVNPLVSSSLVAAKANCPNDGAAGAAKPKTAPSASESVANVTLLGGLITLGVLDGQIVNLNVNNVAYPTGVLSLPTVTVAGVTISPYGNSVLVSIPLSVAQILAGLGLSSTVITALNTFAPTSTLALRLVVGPNATVTSKSVTAWGLGIGVDLSGSLNFNLLGLVTASVNVPTGISGNNYGNLLDLRLAYVTCQSGVNLGGSGGGSSSSVPAVPPALV
jgi:hypothetical protein